MERLKGFLPALLIAACVGLLAFASMSSMNAKKVSGHTAIAMRAELAKVQAEVAEAKALAEFTDRVIDLPEDAGAWHTTVITNDPPSAKDLQLVGWFDSDPQLANLKRQTHWHWYSPKSSVYERYANVTATGLPVILVQDQTGKTVYKASGANAPNAPWPLVKGIVECVRAHCPHCPRPKPTPAPVVPPVPVVPDVGPPHIIPDVVGPNDNTPGEIKDDTIPVTIAAGLIALAIGFVSAARKQGRRS